jgi:hypothetical protein
MNSISSYPLSIGEVIASNTSYFHLNGDLDEIMMFDYALSDTQVADLYNALGDEYKITGTVLQDGEPVVRTVRIYRRDNGKLVREVQSEVDGTFDARWRELYPNAVYYAVAMDDEIVPALQPIAHDRLTPILVT